MAVREIRHLPDQILRKKAKTISSLDGSLQRLIDDMIDTLHKANGVGLAAPQVGVSLRVAVIQMPEEEPIVLINPKIVKRTGERQVTEGCLSIPGFFGEIIRSVSVTVRAQDRNGKLYKVRGTGLLAEALEHELDHLNGVLYIDHLESSDMLHKVEPEKLETQTSESNQSSENPQQ